MESLLQHDHMEWFTNKILQTQAGDNDHVGKNWVDRFINRHEDQIHTHLLVQTSPWKLCRCRQPNKCPKLGRHCWEWKLWMLGSNLKICMVWLRHRPHLSLLRCSMSSLEGARVFSTNKVEVWGKQSLSLLPSVRMAQHFSLMSFSRLSVNCQSGLMAMLQMWCEW